MKIKRKKDNQIPKNITKQNIDMFNQALGSGDRSGGTSVTGCSESVEEEKFYYDDYTYAQIDEACEELVNDYIEKRFLIRDFLSLNRDYILERKIWKEFGVRKGSEVDNDEAAEIIDKYLWEICMTVDEQFVQEYLKNNF